jgi:hypothetical protein
MLAPDAVRSGYFGGRAPGGIISGVGQSSCDKASTTDVTSDAIV